MKKAYFAGGCFWCVTPIYKLYGVDRVTAGYSGGDEPDPTYKEVKSGKTGHRETIEIEYDPGVISYDELLEIYFANIDPFDGDGQFIDRGFSYTPAIFYETEEELAATREKLNALARDTGKEPAVAFERFKSFYLAEEEHQDYYLKNPEAFEEEMRTSGRKK